MFIIPCKFSKSNPIIFECVKRIKNIYPNEKIVVVDSCSDDDYYKSLDVFDVLFENKNYEMGAFISAYEKYPNEERYFCIHDSLMINNEIPERDLSIVQHFYWNLESHPVNVFRNTMDMILDSFNVENKMKNHFGCFGSIFFCNNFIMKEVAEKVKNYLPTSKIESEFMERIVGLLFEKLGYDLSQISIQGIHIDQQYSYDKMIVEKIFIRRQ